MALQFRQPAGCELGMHSSDAPQASCWIITDRSQTDCSLQLRLRLTPKSSRDAIEGLTDAPEGPAIKARVRAIPENGAANKALIATVAKWLSLPKSNISLSSGAKSRTKLLSIVIAKADLDQTLKQLNALTEH